jgi:hypothetical protein
MPDIALWQQVRANSDAIQSLAKQVEVKDKELKELIAALEKRFAGEIQGLKMREGKHKAGG